MEIGRQIRRISSSHAEGARSDGDKDARDLGHPHGGLSPYQALRASETARTMSRSFGKRKSPFLATSRAPTQIVNSPVFPGTSSASTPNSFFSVSATRAALGLYEDQTKQ